MEKANRNYETDYFCCRCHSSIVHVSLTFNIMMVFQMLVAKVNMVNVNIPVSRVAAEVTQVGSAQDHRTGSAVS